MHAATSRLIAACFALLFSSCAHDGSAAMTDESRAQLLQVVSAIDVIASGSCTIAERVACEIKDDVKTCRNVRLACDIEGAAISMVAPVISIAIPSHNPPALGTLPTGSTPLDGGSLHFASGADGGEELSTPAPESLPPEQPSPDDGAASSDSTRPDDDTGAGGPAVTEGSSDG